MAKNTASDGLTDQQRRFVEGLLLGKSIAEAARFADCSRRAATYWMRDPEHPVRLVYEQRRATIVTSFEARISRLHDLTMRALEDLLSKETPPVIRVAACKLIYESTLAEHSELRQPKSTRYLLGAEADAHYNDDMQWRSIDVRLYDAKGKERLEDIVGDDVE